MPIRSSRATYIIKGRGGFDRMPLARGGKLKGQTRLLIVGVDAVKHSVQKRLAMEEAGLGYIRSPDHLPPEYFEGLASEELRVRYVMGAQRYEHHRIIRQNEALDCLVYASAIAATVKPEDLNKPTLTPKPFDAKKFAE